MTPSVAACGLVAAVVGVVLAGGGALGADPTHWQYMIVGAGPGGLQLAHYMHEAGRDYVVVERSNVSGNFFTRFPRHNKLISINKRYTGKTNKEFNLRHDWNSLLSNDESLQMRYYSEEFFPHRESYVTYLKDYTQKLNLNVMYNTEVADIKPQPGTKGYTMHDQNGKIYTCDNLIVATGLGKPQNPPFDGDQYVDGYEDMSVDPKEYEGQTVLILGRGNSAFEVADSIYGHTNLIHMIGRSRVRLSWATHYVGDLRAVNNGLLDTYQLKSLDGILEGPIEEVRIIKKEDGKLYLDLEGINNTATDRDLFDNFALRDPYDRVIRCLGFQFEDDIFDKSIEITRGSHRLTKYPAIKYNYESINYENLFFAGTVTHSLDHRKSAGGFIHGFRYTSRMLHRLLEVRNHGKTWPFTRNPVSELLSNFVKRINEGSGIYQMYNMLVDVAVFRNGHTEVEYYEEFPLNLLDEFEKFSGRPAEDIVVLSLEYGANFSGPGEDIFRLDRSTGEPSEGHVSNFLHPVFYYYKQLPTRSEMENRFKWQTLPRPARMHHVVEDFLTAFNARASHVLPLRRFIENIIDEDMRFYYSNDCFAMALTHQEAPHNCRTQYMAGQGNMDLEPTHATLLDIQPTISVEL